jgi:hypothetical protein
MRNVSDYTIKYMRTFYIEGAQKMHGKNSHNFPEVFIIIAAYQWIPSYFPGAVSCRCQLERQIQQQQQQQEQQE